MFSSIKYVEYDNYKKCNIYTLYDTCFNKRIVSPFGSPSLKDHDNRLGNTLTMLSIIRHYETINRNVAPNIANYYVWLCFTKHYKIDELFIKKQFSVIDTLPNMNITKKYYNNTIRYIDDKQLLGIMVNRKINTSPFPELIVRDL